MKNGDLVVQGKRVDELDLNLFTNPDQFCDWEYGNLGDDTEGGVYAAYDKKYGKSIYGSSYDRGSSLADIFGKKFSDRFYGRRAQLVAKIAIPAIEKEIAQLTELLDKARTLAVAEEPREDPSYYSRLVFWSTK
jgi:hypothetical protein